MIFKETFALYFAFKILLIINPTYSIPPKPAVPVSPPGSSDLFIKDFKNYVEHLPITSFEGDAILVQFLDRLNTETTYRHVDALAVTEIIYRTSNVDKDAEVVILNTEEDKIIQKNKFKRIYVVLRKAHLLDPKIYYVSYVYMTEAAAGKPGVHNFGDKKVNLEWDFWDNREDRKDFRAKKLDNAFQCSNSIFIPCASNETFDFPLPAGKPPINPYNQDVKKPKPPPHVEVVHKGIQAAEGFDADEFMDIYSDLDKSVKEGRVLSEAEEAADVIINTQKHKGRGMIDKAMAMGQSTVGFASNMVHQAISVVTAAGMGLIKSYEGLFGGLGTPEADPGLVEIELGIEGGDRIAEHSSSAEQAELEAQLKLPTAGGLGGLVNLGDEKEMETPQGRSIGGAWDPLPIVQEKPYVQYGWQKVNFDPMAAMDPFVGFGGCRYHKVRVQDLDGVKAEDELIYFYQTVLKTQCIRYDAEFLQEILVDGLLHSDKELSFELNPQSPHFQVEKLNVKQLKELLRGFELFIFSKVYNAELRSPSPTTTAPDGSTLSRSVYLLGQMIISATAMAQEDHYPLKHAFKLSRNFIKSLKTAYQKLLEDKQILGEGDTGYDKETNFNDRVCIMSVIQYIMHGATPVFTSAADPFKNYEDFFHKNKAVFEDLVNNQ